MAFISPFIPSMGFPNLAHAGPVVVDTVAPRNVVSLTSTDYSGITTGSPATIKGSSAALAPRDIFALTNGDHFGITVGSPFTIEWTSATGDIDLTLLNGPATDMKPVSTIASGLSSSSHTWTPSSDLISDMYAIQISDESGTINYSPRFWISSGAPISDRELATRDLVLQTNSDKGDRHNAPKKNTKNRWARNSYHDFSFKTNDKPYLLRDRTTHHIRRSSSLGVTKPMTLKDTALLPLRVAKDGLSIAAAGASITADNVQNLVRVHGVGKPKMIAPTFSPKTETVHTEAARLTMPTKSTRHTRRSSIKVEEPKTWLKPINPFAIAKGTLSLTKAAASKVHDLILGKPKIATRDVPTPSEVPSETNAEDVITAAVDFDDTPCWVIAKNGQELPDICTNAQGKMYESAVQQQ